MYPTKELAKKNCTDLVDARLHESDTDARIEGGRRRRHASRAKWHRAGVSVALVSTNIQANSGLYGRSFADRYKGLEVSLFSPRPGCLIETTLEESSSMLASNVVAFSPGHGYICASSGNRYGYGR